MKIGILTFHNAVNIGAALQAYALDEYINDNLCESEIIDFIPESDTGIGTSIVFKFLKKIKRIGMYFLNRKQYIRECKFIDFRKMMRISKEKYEGDFEMRRACFDDKYSIIISGSDQILNTTLSGNSTSYYLDFWDGAKVSYASSFGRIDVSELELKLIENELPKFLRLSVREESGGQLIENITGIKAQLVLDPVFLLERDAWEKMISRKKNDNFIFAYLMEKDDKINNLLEIMAKITNCSVITVYGGGTQYDNLYGKVDKECGPLDFLEYINNAKFVVTNSFHGTAFSLIFGKKFICVRHSSRNTRLENILNLCGFPSKLLNLNELKNASLYNNYLIDGAKGYAQLNKEIVNSKKYLDKALYIETERGKANE